MKIKHSLIVIFIAALMFGCETSSTLKSPAKDYFVKYYGGDGNQFATDLIVGDDGTFYILGNSRRSPGEVQRVFLVHADAQGNVIKQITYGNVEMEARDFQWSKDKTMLVVVANKNNSTDTDILLSRFDPSLNIIDSLLLQAELAPTKNVYANALTVLSDGGYLVAGYTDYVTDPTHQFDALHLRVKIKNGSLYQMVSGLPDAWKETSGSGTFNSAARVFELVTLTPADTLYYVMGTTNATNNQTGTDTNFWTFGINGSNSDNTEFESPSTNETLTNAVKISLGGYLMTGVSVGTNLNMSAVVKTLKNDKLSFGQNNVPDVNYTYQSTSLGKPASTRAQFATACDANSSSGFFLLSNTYNTASGASDMFLMKLDLLLQEAWLSPVNIGGDGEDTAAAVAELPDGHIMVLGTMNIGDKPEQFKIALLKLNGMGKLAE
ncbi:MAG: hypothetical protein JST48_12240 [Bacteroidetes bacterium]|nr:hypothetical protein [Bacteroidota bacterium]